MYYRQRARYSQNAGLMRFKNPSGDGPLAAARFCSVDSMFHIDMRYSSFPADDSADFSGTYGVIRTDIKHAIQIACGHGLIPFGENSGKGTLLSIWSVGDIDLEDMTTIIEGIPELQANWLRTEVNALKIRAGLSPDDLPYLDRDWNHREGSYVTGGEFVRREWYSSGWMSAKGGTLKFDAGAPPEILATVSEGLRRKGATGTFGCFTMDNKHCGSYGIGRMPISGKRVTLCER